VHVLAQTVLYASHKDLFMAAAWVAAAAAAAAAAELMSLV
jgi:hypothetical protein